MVTVTVVETIVPAANGEVVVTEPAVVSGADVVTSSGVDVVTSVLVLTGAAFVTSSVVTGEAGAGENVVAREVVQLE